MDEKVTRAWEIMAKLDICMLVTRAGSGLKGRPMSTIVRPEEGKVYILSDARAAADDEIEANPDVLLAYGNGASQFVSAQARALVSRDRVMIERLWNPGAQAFWPDGPSDPNVVCIVATPGMAEFWDGDGAVLGSMKALVAILTGTTPAVGDAAKVGLR